MKIVQLTTDNREPYKGYDELTPWFGTAPEALLQGLARLPGIEIHVVSCIRRPVSSPAKIAPNIFFHSLVVPQIGWMRTFYQGCIRATRKKIRELQPDIVHGQGTELDSGISGALSGFPNVLTIHGNMKAIAQITAARPGSFLWLAARLETFTLKKTAGVFCNSAYTENLVAARAKKTWRVPNALRLDFFQPPAARKPGPVPVLLNVGVIQPRKRQLELLALARKLHRRGLKFEMLFIGDGLAQTEYGRAFAREIAEAERAGFARHLGLLATPQLISLMDQSDALIHFPIEEAFGLVTAEALARNLKFFGSAVGGGVEIAGDAEGAELLPADDFDALEKSLVRWIEAGCPPPQKASNLMRERYHPEVVARRHVEIYREVLAHRRG